jgi:hypothetical protein
VSGVPSCLYESPPLEECGEDGLKDASRGCAIAVGFSRGSEDTTGSPRDQPDGFQKL